MVAFVAKRVERESVQRIEAAAEAVFPLLCPVREREYLEGWECRVDYSVSGLAEEGMIFSRRLAGEPETIWTVTEYDAGARRIGFVQVTPGLRVGRVRIEVRETGAARCEVALRYAFTGLSEAGNRFVEGWTAEKFGADMDWFARSMEHYLQTGEKLGKNVTK